LQDKDYREIQSVARSRHMTVGGWVRRALERARSIEEQVREAYGSFQGGLRQESTEAQRQSMGYYHWNEHPDPGQFPGGYG